MALEYRVSSSRNYEGLHQESFLFGEWRALMNKITGSTIIRIVGGGLIVYQGVSIFLMIHEEEPSNYVFMLTIAGVFVVLGALFVVLGLKALFKKTVKKEEENSVLESEEQERNLEPSKKEPEPRKAKTMRERAMMSGGNDEPKETNLSLQNTDVDIASEDIIAATEEFIATEESENTIATLNLDESEEGIEPAQNELDDGLTKVIR